MPLEKPPNMYASHEMVVLAAVGVDVGGAGVTGAGVTRTNDQALSHAPNASVVTPFLVMEG